MNKTLTIEKKEGKTNMLKAKKSLVIALLAALMTFAFGAASTFAADNGITDANGYIWTSDFSSVQVDGQDYPTTRVLQSDGLIKAEIDLSDYTPAPTISPAVQPMYFYDLDGVALDYVGNYAMANFDALFDANGVIANAKLALKTPAYVENAKTAASTTKTQLTGWNAKVNKPAAYDPNATTDQSVTLEAAFESTGEANGSVTAPYVINKPASLTKSINVKAGAGKVAFYQDEVGSDGILIGEATYTSTTTTKDIVIPYDGKTHKIVNSNAAGKTVTYYVLNTATGNYDQVAECPTFTTVDDKATVKAAITWETKTPTVTTRYTENWIFNVSVKKSGNCPTYAWTTGNGGVHGGVYYDFSMNGEQAADPTAWIEFKNGFTDKTGNPDADLETIKAFFLERYDVTVTKNKIDAELQDWEIEAKDLSAAELKALEKKYKALLDTYTFAAKDTMKLEKGSNTVTVMVKGAENVKVDDITFTTAPNMKYKAKKLKKKARSFTVEAVADSGNTIKYMMTSPSKKISIDSATGKVTVAKKTKKGTYKVKIKAKTEAGNGYQACKEEVQLKIKVKK